LEHLDRFAEEEVENRCVQFNHLILSGGDACVLTLEKNDFGVEFDKRLGLTKPNPVLIEELNPLVILQT
jgi:hypothetical protein